MNIWQILGIEPTNEVAHIRRAYAQQLKQHRPDSDPQGYQQLREAFEQAKAMAESGFLTSEDSQPDEPETSPGAVALDKNEVIFLRTEPELSLVPPTGNVSDVGPVWSAQEITTLVSELMESEVRGAGMLETLWGRVAHNGSLLQQQLFHQELARTLAEQPGLTEGLLESVSARLGWGLDEYEPARVLGPHVLAALEAQLRETEVSRGWKQLQVESESGGFLQRMANRLLQSERAEVPFWMRLVPGLVKETQRQVTRLSHYYPELLNRLNPAFINFVQQPRLAASWSGILLCIFWGALFTLVWPAPGVWGGAVIAVAAVVFFWLFGRDVLLFGLARWRSVMTYYLAIEFVLAVLVAVGGFAAFTVIGFGLVESGDRTGGKELLGGVVVVLIGFIYWLAWPKFELFIRKPGEMLRRIFASPWTVLELVEFAFPAIFILPVYFMMWFGVLLALLRFLSPSWA